jgi:ABC-type sugar transport system substrate-binding protein
MKKATQPSTISEIPNLDAFVNGGNDNRTAAPQAVTVAATPQVKESTVIATIRAPESVHKRLKVHCAMTGQSIQDFTLKAWETQLAAEQGS